MSQGEIEKRFAHLLQPIRDLTKNWEVDVAAELKEYLLEIESIKISFDGGATTMNFAEAALLIQGSACVYSKKVEYLYCLVYQTLDLLCNKRKQQIPNSVDTEGNDKDTSFANRNIDHEFLLLDDVKDSGNVDMKTTENNVIQLLHQTPMSLQKLDDINKDSPLLSQKGETLGNRGDFRFNTGNIHSSGILLVDFTQLAYLEGPLNGMPRSTPIGLDNDILTINISNVMPDIPQILDGHEEHDLSLDDVDMADPVEEEQDQQVSQRMALRARQPVQVPVVKFIDPWQQQEPHDAEAAVYKPIKKGNPSKVPALLETRKKRKRKQTPEKAPLPPLTEFITKTYNTHSNKLPSSALKRPVFEELEYLYWPEFRRQQESFRNQKKSLARQGRYQELEEREKEEEEERQKEEERNENPLCMADNDDNGPDDFGFAGNEDDDADPSMNDYVPPIAIEDEEPVISNYEDLVRHHVESYLVSAQKFAQLTELSRRVSEWEDKISPILVREENYGYFDIHEYGTEVLRKLNNLSITNKTKEVTFKEIVSETKVHDISRLFLASLQLANSGNVDINSDTIDGETSVDTMRLTLLQQDRHHEQFAVYRAPSVVT